MWYNSLARLKPFLGIYKSAYENELMRNTVKEEFAQIQHRHELIRNASIRHYWFRSKKKQNSALASKDTELHKWPKFQPKAIIMIGGL